MRTPAVYARAARTLVALLTVVSLLTPFAAARGAAGCGSITGNWAIMPGPEFPAGAQRISDLAIDASSPSRLYVTNETSVMRSLDGGCTWEHSFTLGEQEASGPTTYTPANAAITKLVAAESGGRVLMSIAETTLNQTRPHVLVSSDSGRSWQSGDAGLPPLGSPEVLVVASSSPDTVYLGVDRGGGTLDSLWASSDGGTSWQARSQRLNGDFVGFEVDPLVANEVWAWGNGLNHSTDGGATWTPVDEFVGTVTGPVDAFHAGSTPSDVFTFIPGLRSMQRSRDGGETWLEAYGLTNPDSIDHGGIADSRVATAQGKMWVWAPALFSWADARAPVGGLRDVNATRSETPAFVMHNGSQIVVYAGQTGSDYSIPDKDFVIGNLSLVDPPSFVEEPPELTPKDHTIKIPAGDEKRVTYDLSLSKTRTPLDLYFVIDTSESAKPFLRGLAFVLQDLVNELTLARLDVRFGLAEYRAYPDSTPPRPYCESDDVPVVEDPQCERNFVYRQLLDLPNYTPDALAAAIEDLDPVAGGHYDASLAALYQTATGAGEDVWPQGTTASHLDGHDVPPGQEASYSDKALKVALIATDEGFINRPYPDDDFPPDQRTMDEVIAALNARGDGIKQIGLALGNEALKDMRKIATATGAVAPAEGADCDGNGSAEIAPASPLVCTVSRDSLEQGSNLVPAIVNMVEAVRDSEDVTLDVVSEDDRVVAGVTPDRYPGVVLQADHALKFDVTYECPTSMAGERTKVNLTASQGPDELAVATTTVLCGKVDQKKKGFFTTFPFDRVLGILPLLPLSPPPTLANPSSATQAQSQAQAQGAMAAQEQQQPQVAYAIQHKAALREALAKEDQEYQMTSYRDRSEPAPGLFLAAGAVMMSAAYALAMSRRRRAELALQRRR